MAKCYECIEYTRCLLKGDEDALNLNEGMEVCRGFAHKDICYELISHIGETIYKICPKCNPDHNESCNRCAWRGCMSLTGCDVFGLWEDGQYPAEQCTIVPKIIHWNFIPAIAKELGNKAFLNRDDAVRKLESLKALKGGTE